MLLPVDWQIQEDTVVQPDVLVACDKNIINIDAGKLDVPPVMAFEVQRSKFLRSEAGAN